LNRLLRRHTDSRMIKAGTFSAGSVTDERVTSALATLDARTADGFPLKLTRRAAIIFRHRVCQICLYYARGG
jgi:hypothetical protein